MIWSLVHEPMLHLSEFGFSFRLRYYFILKHCGGGTVPKVEIPWLFHSSVALKRGDEDDLVVGSGLVSFTLLGQIRGYLVRLASVSLTTCGPKGIWGIRKELTGRALPLNTASTSIIACDQTSKNAHIQWMSLPPLYQRDEAIIRCAAT